MREYKALQLCVLLTAGSMLFASNGLAQGKIVIQPKVRVGAQNDSNFWKSQDNEVSVNTYTAKPGMVFGYETEKTEIFVDAELGLYWYDDQDTPPEGVRDASDDDYVGFDGNARFNHQLTDRLNVGVEDQLFVTRDPARADGNSNSVNRDKYTINYFEPNAYYDFSDKFGLLVKYRNTYTDYEKDLEDNIENRGTADFYYNLNRSAAVYLDYQVWMRDYDQDSNDYLSNKISLNYEHKLNYLSIKGGAGYHNRTFDDDSLDDLDLFSWKVELRGIDPDTTKRTTRSWVEFDLGQDLNDDGTGDSYFTATYVDLEVGYRFFEKLALSLRGEYQNSSYETDNRDEDTYNVSSRVEYRAIDYLALGLEGGFESRESNVDGNDYDNTFVMFTLDVDYDFGSK